MLNFIERRITLIILMLVILALSILFGCFEPEYKSIILWVYHIDVIDTVSIGETIDITLHFIIPNGCTSFRRLEVYPGDKEVRFKVWGRRKLNAYCTQSIDFDSTKYSTLPEYSGTYLIEVIQPDKSFYIDSVWVE